MWANRGGSMSSLFLKFPGEIHQCCDRRWNPSIEMPVNRRSQMGRRVRRSIICLSLRG